MGEFKMFAIVLKLMYLIQSNFYGNAQLDILHQRAEGDVITCLLDLSIPYSDWRKILLELLCLLNITAKKTRMVVNYQLSVFPLMHVSMILLNQLFWNIETKS